MHSYKIIDNFLEEKTYHKIKEKLHSEDFAWFWHANQVDIGTNDSFYFGHNFYSKNQPQSNELNMLDPIFKQLDIEVLLNARANLVVKTENGWNEIHTDMYTRDMIHNTSIMYFSTNNGKTVLLVDNKEVEIETVDNRILIFDSKIPHYAKHQTDDIKRIVLNINYI